MNTTKYYLLSLLLMASSLNANTVPSYDCVSEPCPDYSEGQGVSMTQQEAQEVLPYAQMAYNAFRYKPSDCVVEGYHLSTKEEVPVDLQQYYDAKAQRLEDAHTGMIARIYIKDDDSGQRVVAFAGSELRFWQLRNIQRFTYNLMSNTAQALGYEPQVYTQAAKWAQSIQGNASEGPEVILTGSSLGGGLAQYAGLMMELRAVCFNAAGMSSVLKKFIETQSIGEVLRARAYSLVVHVNVEGDWISSYAPGEQLGVRYVVPCYSEKIWGFGFGSENRHDASIVVKSLEAFSASE
ncbi:MAG: hypothetical protein B7X06_00295 [Verrucomicrobia bacterium 21-51-4]|nr:MAG: hypothetical protein B7X06_00295 [Verrucomicrobia bacterium 21-51-4]HQU08552.1 hypothetical protein [Opitutales bacterium]